MSCSEFKEKILKDRVGYGTPEDNFTYVAELWTAHIRALHRKGLDALRPSDVCLMMDMLKTGRATTGDYNADNAVDKKGYTELYDLLARDGK